MQRLRVHAWLIQLICWVVLAAALAPTFSRWLSTPRHAPDFLSALCSTHVGTGSHATAAPQGGQDHPGAPHSSTHEACALCAMPLGWALIGRVVATLPLARSVGIHASSETALTPPAPAWQLAASRAPPSLRSL